jgi:hypothetical protein
MLGALRNSITGLLGRSGLGGVRAKSTTGLAIASFSRCGHRGARNLDASTKYGMVATPSRSPAAGGGDLEDVGAVFGDKGKGEREAAATPTAQPGVEEAGEGPGAEEAEVVAPREGEW